MEGRDREAEERVFVQGVVKGEAGEADPSVCMGTLLTGGFGWVAAVEGGG